MSRLVVFYRDLHGRSPVEEFLDGLKPKAAQKVVWTLKLIEQETFVPARFFKKLVGTNDLWEVRVSADRRALRLLGFMDRGGYVVLTHAFAKRSQKTPARDIVIAERRIADWKQRHT